MRPCVMYTTINFRTKKELQAAVDGRRILTDAHQHISHSDIPATLAGCEAQEILRRCTPREVTYFQPGPFGGNEPQNSNRIAIEGPHGFHRWYAECTAANGVIVGVK